MDLLTEHYLYLADSVRISRYQATVDQVVRPGHTVLDLGCGTGVLGLMALRAGAARVYFVDETSAIELARQAIDNAGFSEQAQFFRTNSYELALPEHVDVVICDHVGCFGFDYNILGVLADARKRFLKPDGILIPQQIDLEIAPVQSPHCRETVDRWKDEQLAEEFRWIASLAANTKQLEFVEPDDLLGEPATLASLKPGWETDDFHRWDVSLTAARDGTLDGLAGWFDCMLTDGIRMSNSPLPDDRIRRAQAFLPLESPLPVAKGERIDASVMVRHLDHVIAWNIELPDSGQHASLSTFNGLLLDRETISRTQPTRPALLNNRGRARQVIASHCDGSLTLAEVEALVRSEHADILPSERALERMLRHVLASDTGD